MASKQELPRPLVKICGISNAAEARLVLQADVDMIGVIILPQDHGSLTPHARDALVYACTEFPQARRVAVTSCQDESDLHRLLGCGLFTHVQLQFRPNLDLMRRLRSASSIELIPVIADSVWCSLDASEVRTLCCGVLMDASYTGGLGRLAPKNAVVDAMQWWNDNGTFILAGGLTPANVGRIVSSFGVGGVDVLTGVRTHNRHLSPARVRRFVSAARSVQGGEAETATVGNTSMPPMNRLPRGRALNVRPKGAFPTG